MKRYNHTQLLSKYETAGDVFKEAQPVVLFGHSKNQSQIIEKGFNPMFLIQQYYSNQLGKIDLHLTI